MARTTFSGPVASDNGFEGNISATSATIGVVNIPGTGNAVSGTVSAAIGYLPVTVNGVVKYIQLFSSLTP